MTPFATPFLAPIQPCRGLTDAAPAGRTRGRTKCCSDCLCMRLTGRSAKVFRSVVPDPLRLGMRLESPLVRCASACNPLFAAGFEMIHPGSLSGMCGNIRYKLPNWRFSNHPPFVSTPSNGWRKGEDLLDFNPVHRCVRLRESDLGALNWWRFKERVIVKTTRRGD
jgi:hypothetical protein